MKYQAVIFDLDGTILATLEDLANSLNYALEQNGLPKRSLDEVRSFVGNGMRKLMERGVPSNTDTLTIDKVHNAFTQHYKKHSADNTKAYDGIYGMLDELKASGIKLAVLSNKADYAVKALCDKYFNGYFDVCAGEIAGIPRKPEPKGVYLIIEQLNVCSEKCVYVGDSEVDILTAKNAGIDCISVDWGFRDRQVLIKTGANAIASNSDELLSMIIG